MQINRNRWIKNSIERQKLIHENSIILNPVENVPLGLSTSNEASFLQGLYVTDQFRENIKKLDPKIIFAGRHRSIVDTNKIQKWWAEKLKANDCSLRLLSGLHAHIIIFMSIGQIGDTVLLLPEVAGGHFSTKKILERLGYNVIEMVADKKNFSVDVKETRGLITENKPKFVFFDRSEGLNYEDISSITDLAGPYYIFDASQYLTNIIAGHYIHPFDMGFNMLVSTIHKNFPGPQKALVCVRESDSHWEKLVDGMACYVSNSHVLATYMAGIAISKDALLHEYSERMLGNKMALEKKLSDSSVPVIKTKDTNPPSQHIWILQENKQAAFHLYKLLEKCRILTNYRTLPYELGYGIRIGTANATINGLRERDCSILGEFIIRAYEKGYSTNLKHNVRNFVAALKENAIE